MSKASTRRLPPETALARYDWSRARRGRYAARKLRTAKVILVPPEIYEHFGGADQINEALRTLVQLSRVVAPRHRKSRAA